MNALWRLQMGQRHASCVLIVLATCVVCRLAAAQDNTAKAGIFLAGEMQPAPAQQTDTSGAVQLTHPIPSRPPPLPFYVNALQYLTEKRGKVPVVSGLDGKLQLELGLFGYLGVKYSF